MEKLEFKVSINAPKEKVWKILRDDVTYRDVSFFKDIFPVALLNVKNLSEIS